MTFTVVRYNLQTDRKLVF